MTPIACRLDALSIPDRRRRAEVLAGLQARAVAVEDSADGITFVLRTDPEASALAGEFVGYEARCCPFIRFQITVEEEGGPIRLAMSGREGVAEFLRATFRPSPSRPS